MEKGWNFIILTAVVSGVSIFVNKLGVTGINPYLFTFSKNVIVSVFLLSTLLLLGQFSRLKTLNFRQWRKLILIGLVGGSVPFLLFFKGLSMTSSATGSLIHKSMFILVFIFAGIFLKEKISKKTILAALALLVGNALLLGVSASTIGSGEILILSATFFWACENVISKHALREIPSKTVAFGRMFFGSLFILVFLGFTGQLSGMLALNVAQIKWIILTSGFLFFYVSFWYAGLKYVNVSKATTVLLVGSPITTMLSYIFLGANISFTKATGMFLILMGVIAVVGVHERIKDIHLDNVRSRHKLSL